MKLGINDDDEDDDDGQRFNVDLKSWLSLAHSAKVKTDIIIIIIIINIFKVA